MKSFITRLGLVLGLLTTGLTGFAADTRTNYLKWENDIATFEHADATNPPPKGAVLFAGSSTIRLWQSLAQDLPNLAVINRGFGGSWLEDSTHFADRIIFPYAPSKIVLRAGGNDLASGKSPEQVFADYQEFVAVVHAKLPEAEIIFISWAPTIARWNQVEKEKTLNKLVANYAKAHPKLGYIETSDLVLGADGKPRAELFRADKTHFNDAGYRLLAERVRAYFATVK